MGSYRYRSLKEGLYTLLKPTCSFPQPNLALSPKIHSLNGFGTLKPPLFGYFDPYRDIHFTSRLYRPVKHTKISNVFGVAPSVYPRKPESNGGFQNPKYPKPYYLFWCVDFSKRKPHVGLRKMAGSRDNLSSLRSQFQPKGPSLSWFWLCTYFHSTRELDGELV